MRVTVEIDGDLNALMKREVLAGERAVKQAMAGAATALKADWRAQVTGAGLGARLGNTVRGEAYPKAGSSLNSAAWVYTRAPQILAGHNDGSVIRSTGGFWLAIPLPAAGKAGGGASFTPGTWQFAKGKKLRFVPTGPGKALLVADDARLSNRGVAARKGGKRRSDGILSGAQTVPIFALVRQVKLPKRLNLFPAAERIAAGLPGSIVANWRE